MIFFLDANILIWRFEGLSPFYIAARAALDELAKAHADASLAVSRLSWLECRIKPLRDRDLGLLARYEELFASGIRIVELSAEVVDQAAELRARHNLKTPDALQAASALHLPGPLTFVTGDSAFARVPGLIVRMVKPQARPKRSTL